MKGQLTFGLLANAVYHNYPRQGPPSGKYYSRVFTLSVWLLPHRSLSRAAPAARCDGE
jgi:hypothetical protein